MRFLPKAAVTAIFVACFAWSAGAVPITYQASLSGPAESPPVDSPGTGSTQVTIDTDANTFHVSFVFANLLAGTTVAHIHGPTLIPFEGNAGVMTTTPSFPDFPTGVTSGSYDRSFDLTDAGTYNPAFIAAQGGSVAAAEAALAAALAEGRAYLNIHSELFPSGEIRGFLTPIPLPAALPLLLGALVAFGLAGRPLRRS
jgi:hypothetical protein